MSLPSTPSELCKELKRLIKQHNESILKHSKVLASGTEILAQLNSIRELVTLRQDASPAARIANGFVTAYIDKQHESEAKGVRDLGKAIEQSQSEIARLNRICESKELLTCYFMIVNDGAISAPKIPKQVTPVKLAPKQKKPTSIAPLRGSLGVSAIPITKGR